MSILHPCSPTWFLHADFNAQSHSLLVSNKNVLKGTVPTSADPITSPDFTSSSPPRLPQINISLLPLFWYFLHLISSSPSDFYKPIFFLWFNIWAHSGKGLWTSCFIKIKKRMQKKKKKISGGGQTASGRVEMLSIWTTWQKKLKRLSEMLIERTIK